MDSDEPRPSEDLRRRAALVVDTPRLGDGAQLRKHIQLADAWHTTASVFEALAVFLGGLGSVLAFAAGVYEKKELSFSAGCCGMVSMVFLRFAAYALKESRENTYSLNRLLGAIGAKPMIDVSDVGVEHTFVPHDEKS